MKLSDLQIESSERAKRRMNIWHGPVRTGKTIASIMAWLNYIDKEAPRGGDLYMIGRTFAALRRNVIMPMEEMVGADFQYYPGKNYARLWGRTIHVLGMSDKRSEMVIRGSTSGGTYGDELTTWPEGAYKMAMTRLSLKGSRLFGTTNPDNPRHYLKIEYLDRARELDLAEFSWPLDANPFLEPEYITNLKKEFTGLFYRRFVLGEWVAAEGAVYGMVDPDLHVIDDPGVVPDEYIVGVDYGTSVPMVFLLIGIHYPHLGRPFAWIEREHYYDPNARQKRKTDAEHAIALLGFLKEKGHYDVPISAIYCDPSAASFRVECANCGISAIRDIDVADNAVVAGISTVSTMLAQGRLRIHRSCENTLREFGGYVWDSNAQSRGEDKPKKEGDHAMDALRYAIHTHFGDITGANAWANAVRGA